MEPRFTAEEKAIYYATGRRAYLGLKPYIKLILLVLPVTLCGAWLQYLAFGLPTDPSASFSAIQPNDPAGFPVWLSRNHWDNFFVPIVPNGSYHYNVLQQFAYFGGIFILLFFIMFIKIAISPTTEYHSHWYPKLFDNKQDARSIHFVVRIFHCILILIHVTQVMTTALVKNRSHIVVGTDNSENYSGFYIGNVMILVTLAFAFFAHWLSWNIPRILQNPQASVNGRLWKYIIDRLKVKASYEKKDIIPYLWLKAKMLDSTKWKDLEKDNLIGYQLKIERFSRESSENIIGGIKKHGKEQNMTMHHCIQGKFGIADWGGISISKIIELLKPDPSAKTFAFFSFGKRRFGRVYYDTHILDNCLKPRSILAWKMNCKPLKPRPWKTSPIASRKSTAI